MAIDLANKTVTIETFVGGEVIPLICEYPTEQELIAYENNKVERKQKRNKTKVKSHIPEMQQKYGKRKVVGIEKTDNVLYNDVPLSSDPDDPGYVKKWKEIIPVICFAQVAQYLFETPRDENVEFVSVEEPDTPGDDEEGDE